MKKNIGYKLYRPTWAEVDLSAIEYNFNQVKNIVKGKAKILVALKADAYGHGAVEVAKRLKKCNVDYLGLATILEALELRANNINTPILLLGVSRPQESYALIQNKLIPTITDLKFARHFNNCLAKVKKKMSVHIKIDTGMGRLGIWHKDSINFIKQLSRMRNLILEGIYTHFPSAEEDEDFTNLQIKLFNELIDDLENQGIHIPLRHAANSSAIMRYRHAHLNLVRPGLMIYGLYSDLNTKRHIKLKPAMSFKTNITYLKEVPKGRSISYGRTFITKQKAKIATIPVGYADGYNRLLSNRAQVLIKGRRCPIVGRVCMDLTMVDVTGVDVKLGDEVVLIGKQNRQTISAEEIAQLSSTISYEVVCWISKRVPRVYID